MPLRKEDWDGVEALIDDDVLRRHCASGTPDQVLAALVAYRSTGLDEIVAYGVQEREQVENALALMRPEPMADTRPTRGAGTR